MSIETEFAQLVATAAKAAFDRLTERIDRLEKLAAKRSTEKLLYTEVEAAKALGISALSLKKYRCKGLIHAHSKIKPILYKWADIEAVADWLAKEGRR